MPPAERHIEVGSNPAPA